jgi:hypothetical protein
MPGKQNRVGVNHPHSPEGPRAGIGFNVDRRDTEGNRFRRPCRFKGPYLGIGEHQIHKAPRTGRSPDFQGTPDFPFGKESIRGFQVPVWAGDAGCFQGFLGSGPIPIPGETETGQGTVPGEGLQTGRLNGIGEPGGEDGALG